MRSTGPVLLGDLRLWVADQEAGLLVLSTWADMTTPGRRMGTGCRGWRLWLHVSPVGVEMQLGKSLQKPRALVLFPWAPVSWGLQADLTVGSQDQTIACGTVVRLFRKHCLLAR